MKFCLMMVCRLVCHVITWPLTLVRITGVYKRLFPALAYNITFSYNDKMHKTKRELFRNVAKFARSDGTLRLLEIGCGSGANFQFYPQGCTVICTDPNPHFRRYLRLSMDANTHLTYGHFMVVSGDNMPEVEDESVDVVVCTLVLCSVRDVQPVLQEVRRILRPVSVSVPPSLWERVFTHRIHLDRDMHVHFEGLSPEKGRTYITLGFTPEPSVVYLSTAQF